MSKLGDTFKKAGDTLKGLPKGRQGRAFMRILQFFAIMVVLTIFARGAAGVTMPEVTVTSLSNQNIRISDDYSGTVSAAGKTEVKMPLELEVEKVAVQAGNTVKAGDELVSFDLTTIDQNLTAQQIALQELKLALAELQKNSGQDDSALESAQKQVDEAQRSYDNAVASGNQNVANAEKAVNDAKAAKSATQTAYNKAKTDFDAFENTNSGQIEAGWKLEPPQNVPKNDGTEDAKYQVYAQWLPLWDTYRGTEATYAGADGAISAANETLASAKASRDEGIRTAQTTLDNARESLAEAQADYNEATPSYNLEAQKNKLEIQKKQLEIEKQQKLLDELYKIQGLGGSIKAPVDGTVTEVSVTAGGTTTDADKIIISTGDEGYVIVFPVPQEKARNIKPGSVVSAVLENYYYGVEARVVGKGLPDEGGQIPIRAQLTGNEWNDGDILKVTVVSSDKQYWSCVPVAAVRPDADGYYVFVLTEESTILGKQTVARKQAVTILDQDKEYAAIDGVVTNDVPRIVVSSSKPVNDGDMVRLSEDSTR